MPIIHQHDPLIILPPDLQMDVLQIEDLNFFYPDGHQALQDIHLSLKAGEKVALVGPNGAGKSTLMLHLNGILAGTGRITVGGMALVKENFPAIRAMVGLVFQNPDDQLFSATVFEDVAFGPLHMGLAEEEVRTRVSSALKQVRMEGYKDRLSHHLSMGEKKRIAIATVLCMQPHVLVLDEPTSGLDPRARRTLIHLLRDLPVSMLVSTHDMALVNELFERMIIMDEGRIVADGKTQVLMADESLLQAHGLEKP